MNDLQFPLGEYGGNSLRPDDLMSAARTAAKALENFLRRYHETGDTADEFRESFNTFDREFRETMEDDDESLSEILDDVGDILTEYAPDYVYYGSHVGDGACVGFWVDVPELSDVDEEDRAQFSVNDHGNVSFYDRAANDDNARLIWGIV